MAVRSAKAQWEGDLKSGRGKMQLGSGALEAPFSFSTRFEEAPGTNPEELIGAAHAGCFSMAFANALSKAGHMPRRIQTSARVHLEKTDSGFGITRIELQTEAAVPGIAAQEFQRIAGEAKTGCPVSKALAGTRIELNARLTG